MLRNKFPKTQKLKSKKAIEALFTEGEKVHAGGINCRYIISPNSDDCTIKTGFAVPKKNFKSAVSRNRIKRQMREVYRKQKGPLLDLCKEKGLLVNIMWVFNSSTPLKFPQMEEKINQCLLRLEQSLKSIS